MTESIVSSHLRKPRKAIALEQISGVRIRDSKIAREVTQFIRDSESDLLFHHSVRVYFWGALTGNRMGLTFDPELLYTAAMFHDVGLTARYENSQLRFEVDGANAARDFLRGHGISESDIETVWNAVALHTTPGIPEFMCPEIALVQAGAGMDVTGRGYDQFTDAQREAAIAAFPRETDFKHGIIDAFYQGMKHRPDSTFGTFNDDVLAFKDPDFRRNRYVQHHPCFKLEELNQRSLLPRPATTAPIGSSASLWRYGADIVPNFIVLGPPVW